MKTCSFRGAQPRSIDEGLFCEHTEPFVQYTFVPCGDLFCGCCYPSYEWMKSEPWTVVDFTSSSMHVFINGYKTYLNCPVVSSRSFQPTDSPRLLRGRPVQPTTSSMHSRVHVADSTTLDRQSRHWKTPWTVRSSSLLATMQNVVSLLSSSTSRQSNCAREAHRESTVSWMYGRSRRVRVRHHNLISFFEKPFCVSLSLSVGIESSTRCVSTNIRLAVQWRCVHFSTAMQPTGVSFLS